LFSSGIKSISELKKIPFERLSMLVGPKIANTIKNQLNGKIEKQKILGEY
jgi:hypothetical protein